MPNSGSGSSDPVGRTNKHHTLPKSRIKTLHKKSLLKRRGTKQINQSMHIAYHIIFNNSFPWEVVKKLKMWVKQQRHGQLRKEENPFFTTFTSKQNEAFKLLFGCRPEEFCDNGHLSNAIHLIENYFYAPRAVFDEFVEAIKSNKPKK